MHGEEEVKIKIKSIRYKLTWRTSVLICPHPTRKFSAVIHSSVLRRVSRAKSCRCVTSRSIRYRSRGSSHCELIRFALGVMLSIVRLRRGGTFASASALGCAIVCLSVYLSIASVTGVEMCVCAKWFLRRRCSCLCVCVGDGWWWWWWCCRVVVKIWL